VSKTPVYITTTLPYVNAEPHVGFAMELVRADIINRFKKLMGHEVFFNTGTDEHGIKIYKRAQEEGKDIKDFVDENAAKFKSLIELLHIDKDIHFLRTTDESHIRAAQEFWKRCAQGGFICKGKYSVKYCTGCELEKTDSELENGHCVLHPNIPIEFIDEENYFFKFSAFATKLLHLYEKPGFVIPEVRLNEIKSFVKQGLQVFSVSRLKEKMPWGIPVPDAPEHVMYVWFDALVSYISTLGWPDEKGDFEKFWVNGETIQYAGKDNLRQQSAMWQAMLMAAGLPNSKHIVINGFITSGGQKMSKSLGNVVDPLEVVNVFGAEAFRYFVARELSSFEDSDFTMEAFKTAHNANLANGLGNLVSRVLTMAKEYGVLDEYNVDKKALAIAGVATSLNNFGIKEAIDKIWLSIGEIDKFIQFKKPFLVYKTDPQTAKVDVKTALYQLHQIAISLKPFMPNTSDSILKLIKEKTTPVTPLFPRME